MSDGLSLGPGVGGGAAALCSPPQHHTPSPTVSTLGQATVYNNNYFLKRVPPTIATEGSPGKSMEIWEMPCGQHPRSEGAPGPRGKEKFTAGLPPPHLHLVLPASVT